MGNLEKLLSDSARWRGPRFAPAASRSRSLTPPPRRGRSSTQPAARREVELCKKDGVASLVEMTLGAVRDPEGQVTHWVAGFADLERLKALAVAA